MAKAKREFRIESDVFNRTWKEFMKFIEKNIKQAGVKYSDDARMYFNVDSKAVYVVVEGRTIEVKLWE